MEEYTIYCTEEQTKKALELGATLQIIDNEYDERRYNFICCNRILYKIPTAEQMIGWLEGQSDIECIDIYKMKHKSVKDTPWTFDISCVHMYSYHPSRPSATLAAIDAALDYLIKNKK